MTFAGKVKTFANGFGTIITENDLELTVSSAACVDGKTLRVGDQVKFDLEDSKTKPGEYEAGNVSGGSMAPGGGGQQWGGQQQWGGAAAGGSWGKGGGKGDWGAAPSAPRTSGKKMKMCMHFPEGTCRKGANCTFAHTEAEIGTTYNLEAGGGGGGSWGGAAAGTGQYTGSVANFTPDKGFGFLSASDGNQYFFHQKQFVDGSAPVQGDNLQFDLEPSPLKEGQMQACNITGGSEKGKGKGKGKGGKDGGKSKGKGKDGGKSKGGKDFGKGKDGKSEGPRLSGKKMKLCEHFPMGTCRKMENCTFAHSEAEIGTPYGPAPAKGGGKGGAGPYGQSWGGGGW